MAAATLVLAGTGVSMAESGEVATAGAAFFVSSPAASATAAAESAQARAEANDLAARRTDALKQTAAAQGRQQQAEAVARAKQRAALAKKKAAAAKKAAELKAGTQWVSPLQNVKYTFTSPYGYRWGALHEGDDFAVATGTPLHAMSKGVVTAVGWMGGAGMSVRIKHWDGTEIYYDHMSRIDVKAGDQVMPNDLVGLSGNTGHSTGPHLHIEVHPNGVHPGVDPLPWLHEHGLFKDSGANKGN